MKTVIFILLLSSTLFGITLNEIIEKSLSSSPSLESINARISANRQDIELSLITNTLDSDQAMSKTTLLIKQKIHFYSKRSRNQKVTLAEEAILNEKLTKAKVALIAAIKIEAYNIWELGELYKIIDEYIELAKQNIELYESYATTTDNTYIVLNGLNAGDEVVDNALFMMDSDAQINGLY